MEHVSTQGVQVRQSIDLRRNPSGATLGEWRSPRRQRRIEVPTARPKDDLASTKKPETGPSSGWARIGQRKGHSLRRTDGCPGLAAPAPVRVGRPRVEPGGVTPSSTYEQDPLAPPKRGKRGGACEHGRSEPRLPPYPWHNGVKLGGARKGPESGSSTACAGRNVAGLGGVSPRQFLGILSC
jgi:hypothetical protein